MGIHQRCLIRILFASAMVANFSLPMGEAYTQPLRRVHDRRRLTAHAPESSFNVSFQIRAFTFYRRFLTHYSHRTILPGGDPLHHHDTDTISYRPVTWDDIHTCCQIAATSCQEDATANFDNLTYMQQYAGEYFWCASLPADEDQDHQCKKDIIIGFISSSRCMDFAKDCISKHDPKGSILAIHSVVVDPKFQYQDIATAMMQNYLTQIVHLSNLIDISGFQTVKLLARSDMLSCYVDMGFLVLRPSPISRENRYELEARQDIMKSLIRDLHYIAQPLRAISRSTSNPDEGIGGTLLVIGREQRRAKLHNELSKLGIDPYEIEHHQERFGTAAIRTYNSFLLPKSAGALAVAESPTRPRVVANNISFLVREFKADQERWLRNVDLNRSVRDEVKIVGVTSETGSKHPITIVLDNIRSAHNVGNILRLAEAAQVDSVRLCGMTPRPPHPKVLKTAMGAAEYVSLGEDRDDTPSTIDTVLKLKANGIKVIGVETTENATCYWDSSIQNNDADDDAASPIAYVFGNELIGVDVEVLRECDEIICLPTYGKKNSLNVATCVGIVVWDRLRNLERGVRQKWVQQ